MDYCGPHGIPYEEFLEWSAVSQQAALDWMIDNRTRCSTCGTHPDDWDEERGGHRDAYVAWAHRCRGDELIHGLQQNYKDDGAGWRFGLAPNPYSPRWGGSGAGVDERVPDRVVGDAGDASWPAEGDSA